MQKNKKIPVSILLVIIYVLFMCQEIMVNQVLCLKDNGDADIELAVFGFQCECKNEDSHTHIDLTQIKLQFCNKCFDCFDLPLDNSWVKRNITKTNLNINLVNQFDLDNQIELQLNNPFGCLPESVPKSKFLYISLSPVNSIVLRC